MVKIQLLENQDDYYIGVTYSDEDEYYCTIAIVDMIKTRWDRFYNGVTIAGENSEAHTINIKVDGRSNVQAIAMALHVGLYREGYDIEVEDTPF